MNHARLTACNRLSEEGIHFNGLRNGAKLVVFAPRGKVDFYPDNDTWRDRKTHEEGAGIDSLIAHVEEQQLS